MPGSVSGSSHPLNNQSSANFPVNNTKNESKTSELTSMKAITGGGNTPIQYKATVSIKKQHRYIEKCLKKIEKVHQKSERIYIDIINKRVRELLLSPDIFSEKYKK